MSALGVWPPKNIDEARKDPYLRALLDHPEWCKGEPIVATRMLDPLGEPGSAFAIARRMNLQTETDLQRMFMLGVKAAKYVYAVETSVLHTEAFEAGRLAAVRADVADFVGWLERDIARDVVLAAESRGREATEAKRGPEYEVTRFVHESIAIRAERRIAGYSGKAADCRRWLEATS